MAANPTTPNLFLLEEKGRRIADIALSLLELELGKLKRGESYSMERIDSLSNAASAGSAFINPDESELD